MTDKELQERLDAFEQDLMARVMEISNHKRSWLYNNIGTIITSLAMLLALAVAWGSSQSEISHILATQKEISGRVDSLTVRVGAHVENTDRHVDLEWKTSVIRNLEDIRSLIVKHMARDIR